VLLHRLATQRIPKSSADRSSVAAVSGCADEARQLVDDRTVMLARLHWALRSQSTRVARAARWLAAVDSPPSRPPSQPLHEAVVLPADVTDSRAPARSLRVVVSQSREVSLEIEDKIPAPAPETGNRYRLAS
jgi:hypothetical protein